MVFIVESLRLHHIRLNFYNLNWLMKLKGFIWLLIGNTLRLQISTLFDRLTPHVIILLDKLRYQSFVDVCSVNSTIHQWCLRLPFLVYIVTYHIGVVIICKVGVHGLIQGTWRRNVRNLLCSS